MSEANEVDGEILKETGYFAVISCHGNKATLECEAPMTIDNDAA